MEPLTTAELRALHALARYETATEAARAAGLSPQTLRNQAAMAYRKLGVNGRVEAFRKIGWLRPPRFMPTAEAPQPFGQLGDGPEEDNPFADADPNVVVISQYRGELLTMRHNAKARRSAAVGRLIRSESEGPSALMDAHH
jgi:DNA-binding CsgD family transcriptional regulator